jgi:Zn-dependent protease with chaperone function
VTSRALLAVSLFAGFYLFGIVLILALLWLPWAQVRYTGGPDLSGLIAGGGALYIAWALVPPRTRWTAPGPELSAKAQPRLFSLIASVAERTGHALPHAVYLVPEAMAFASSRPRWYGLRREPIVGIGLPLFALLTESELAAVVAHEFGHHAGGDVKLGPWQHRTFVAISAALHRLDGSNLFLHLPFYAYGRLFLRLTGAASRQQELRADALAARTVSPAALGGALIGLAQYHASWSAYWHGVFIPAVNAGFRPPIVEGYRRFLAGAPAALATAAPAAPPADDDTHPPLDARLAALGLSLHPREDQARSTALLDDLPDTELRLLAPLLTSATVLGKLTPISWDEWGRRIVPAVWARTMESRMAALRGLELSSLPSLLTSDGLWQRLRSGINVYSAEARRRQLRAWLGHWVALSLLEAGFTVASEPGAEPVLRRDDVVIEPFTWVDDLGSGARNAEEWRSVLSLVAAPP